MCAQKNELISYSLASQLIENGFSSEELFKKVEKLVNPRYRRTYSSRSLESNNRLVLFATGPMIDFLGVAFVSKNVDEPYNGFFDEFDTAKGSVAKIEGSFAKDSSIASHMLWRLEQDLNYIGKNFLFIEFDSSEKEQYDIFTNAGYQLKQAVANGCLKMFAVKQIAWTADINPYLVKYTIDSMFNNMSWEEKRNCLNNEAYCKLLYTDFFSVIEQYGQAEKQEESHVA